MPLHRLETKRVEKPWGRMDLWPGFEEVQAGSAPVGEVWFDAPATGDGAEPDLLIKYLFTSDRLSVQVHPDDVEARRRGHPRGKSEAWFILSAEPDATIAMGTLEPMTHDELRAASLDGSIEAKLDWKPVKPGEFWYAPAGMVHAIGPGLVLIEVQQNVDLTYRLYDYGSDRELHLDDGVAVSTAVPYSAPFRPFDAEPGRTVLAGKGPFVAERWSGAAARIVRASQGRPVWFVPVAGEAVIDGLAINPGGVWMLDADAAIGLSDDCEMLVCYAPVDNAEEGDIVSSVRT